MSQTWPVWLLLAAFIAFAVAGLRMQNEDRLCCLRGVMPGKAYLPTGHEWMVIQVDGRPPVTVIAGPMDYESEIPVRINAAARIRCAIRMPTGEIVLFSKGSSIEVVDPGTLGPMIGFPLAARAEVPRG